MSIKQLQKDIRKNGGLIFSCDTLNLEHLLPKAYDFIKVYNLRTDVADKIEVVFVGIEDEKAKPTFANLYHNGVTIRNKEEANYVWNEDVYNYFSHIAPRGYYFGSSEGDGACIGWFKEGKE